MTKRRRNQHHRRRPRPGHLQPLPSTPVATSRLERALQVDSFTARWLAERVAACGGIEAYEALDAEPIPADEPFDWTGIAADDHAVVNDVLAACDGFTSDPSMCDHGEYTTILRRLLARAARAPERTIRRRTSPERLAAALTWIAMRGNGDLGRRRGQLTAEILWWDYGVTDCAPLARSIATELGMLVEQPGAPARRRWLVQLRDPALMRGFRRGWEIVDRDDAIGRIEAEVERRAEEAIVQITSEGFALRTRDVELAMCVPVEGDFGEPLIAIALGDDPIEPEEAFALSMSDGRRLLESLRWAIQTNERRSS